MNQEQAAPAPVWALAVDTLARASAVAAAATGEEDLRLGTAGALAGPFADWVFVDLTGAGQPRRAVAARQGSPVLSRALTALRLTDAPLISAAVRRRTPLIEAPVRDRWLLGRMPDGKPVAGAVGARSAAVGPIVTADGSACGAITIVRTGAKPYVRFVELGFLCHIAELTGVAVKRLRRR
ncbi:MAG TPA: hypothetical protein VH637_09870 [Streptosporangiaceae bacterium]|jgi:hypothetical protein